MQLVPDAAHVEQLVFVTPQKLPRCFPYGPVKPCQDLVAAKRIAEAAVKAARDDTVCCAERLLTLSWKYFGNTAERELADRTDTLLKHPGRRGGDLVAKWVPVIKTKGLIDDTQLIADGWEWTTTGMKDVLRAAQAERSNEQDEIFNDQLSILINGNVPGSGLCARLEAYTMAAKAIPAQCPRSGPPDDVWVEEAK